eukprot:2949281-Alexandrium_andersonii.AAC.1
MESVEGAWPTRLSRGQQGGLSGEGAGANGNGHRGWLGAGPSPSTREDEKATTRTNRQAPLAMMRGWPPPAPIRA